MSRSVCLVITVLIMLSVLLACAVPAPTAAPTKPAAPVAATAAPAPPAAATSAPAAAAKPAAAAPTSPLTAKVKRGGTLVQAVGASSNTLDPIYDSLGGTTRVLQIYDPLLRYTIVDYETGKSEFFPALAESWERVDPKALVFKLRKGVKFHDGSDFNAEVAKWSLERMGNQAKSLSKSMVANIESIQVVDPYTLRINYKSQSALQLMNLTPDVGGTGAIGTFILSKAHMDKVGEAAFGTNPSGTGAMKLTGYDKDSEYRSVKFDGYREKGADGQPLPYLDGLRTRIMVDVAVQITEFRAGSIQMSSSFAPAELASLKAIPDVDVVILHWAPYRQQFGFNSKIPKYKDNLKLKQAAQYAIDREQMAKTLGLDAGRPNYYMGWVPSWPGYDESLPRYSFDTAKAKTLLKEAGYENGIDIKLMHYTEPIRRRLAEMAQSMWNAAGFRITLEPVDHVAAKDRVLAGTYEMNSSGMSSSPDPAYADRVMICGGAAASNNYCNPEVDKLMAQAAQEFDTAKRADLYKRVQRILYEDAEIGGLYMAAVIMAQSKSLKGVKLGGSYQDLEEAWFDR